MIHVGVDLDFSQVLSILEACVTELGRNKSKLNSPDSEEDIEQYIVSWKIDLCVELNMK